MPKGCIYTCTSVSQVSPVLPDLIKVSLRQRVFYSLCCYTVFVACNAALYITSLKRRNYEHATRE